MSKLEFVGFEMDLRCKSYPKWSNVLPSNNQMGINLMGAQKVVKKRWPSSKKAAMKQPEPSGADGQ